MSKKMNVERKEFTAMIYHNKEDGEYIIGLKSHRGGPVVSANTENEAIEKFNEALKAAFAVNNLYDFRDVVRREEIEKELFPERDYDIHTEKLEDDVA